MFVQFVRQPRKTVSGYVNVAAFSVIFNSQHEAESFLLQVNPVTGESYPVFLGVAK